MANSILYKDKHIAIGDTINLSYKIIEDNNKERIQDFKGILIKISGGADSKMITIRKITKSGIGVERIIPLSSPFLSSIKMVKKSKTKRSKIYFIRGLSDQNLRSKLYQIKTTK